MYIKVIKDSIIYKGEVMKLHKCFECDDAVAKSLIERGFATANVADSETEPEMATGHLEPMQFKDYSYKELQALAKDMGLSAGGSKEELIARITESEVMYPVNDDEEVGEIPMTDMPE